MSWPHASGGIGHAAIAGSAIAGAGYEAAQAGAIEAAGIASAEAFGSVSVGQVLAGVPLPSGPLPIITRRQRQVVRHWIGGAGRIQSAQAVGLPTLSVRLQGRSADLGAGFGSVALSYRPTQAQLLDEQIWLTRRR